MRVHQLTFATLAVVAGLSLTACQNDGGAAQGSPSSSPASSAGSASTGGETAGGDSADAGGAVPGKGSSGSAGKSTTGGSGSGSNTGGKVAKCRTSGLKITATDATVGGDKDKTVAVELKNTGGSTCAISGFAGVDLKTKEGTLSAKRTGEPVVPGTLKSGESTYFGIHYPTNDTGGTGVRITGLVVTPPDETTSVTLRWPGAASLPVTDGSGKPVTVGPIGSAGQGGAQ
ncbi:DUF4232 domain-containing protein [Streptomyces sp. NPDC087440]|uniref:DUF4232 domain-containing protein n=1 Tax=Streptomyces sp. NPDC087440 TaxID=3365790 RepID=UPI0037FD418D